MEAPVLSKNQRKKALSKKKPVKKSIRNVLSRPVSLIWPEISATDGQVLVNKLKELLNYKWERTVSWNELKTVPRKERKEARYKLLGQKYKPKLLEDVIFGVNAVSRALEKHSCPAAGGIWCVLVSSDVQPQHVVRHLLSACRNSRLPALVVPGLRQALVEAVGFSSVALAIATTDALTTPDNDPWCVVRNVVRRLRLPFDGQEAGIPCDENDNDENHYLKCKGVVDDTPSVPARPKEYLYRPTDGRCFVPMATRPNDLTSKTATLEIVEDFIQLDGNVPSTCTDSMNHENAPSTETQCQVTGQYFVYQPRVPILEQLISDPDIMPVEDIIQRLQDSHNVRAGISQSRPMTAQSTAYIPVKIKRLQSNPHRRNKK